MPNWAFTDYAIEGPKETLQKIEQAVLHHDVEENSAEDWEGNVLIALGTTWNRGGPDEGGKYMRGFIRDAPHWCNDNKTLSLFAEEAWGVTDFNEVLEENFPDIKVYWSTEESNEGIYATNDREGKYFPDRFFVDTCINDNFATDYFLTKEDAYQWLSKLTDGKVESEEDVDKFNATCSEDDFIYIHEFKVITE